MVVTLTHGNTLKTKTVQELNTSSSYISKDGNLLTEEQRVQRFQFKFETQDVITWGFYSYLYFLSHSTSVGLSCTLTKVWSAYLQKA